MKWSKQRKGTSPVSTLDLNKNETTNSIFYKLPQKIQRKDSRRRAPSYQESEVEITGDKYSCSSLLLNKTNISCEYMYVVTTSEKKIYYYIKPSKSLEVNTKQRPIKKFMDETDSVDCQNRTECTNSKLYSSKRNKRKNSSKQRVPQNRKRVLMARHHKLVSKRSINLNESRCKRNPPKYCSFEAVEDSNSKEVYEENVANNHCNLKLTEIFFSRKKPPKDNCTWHESTAIVNQHENEVSSNTILRDVFGNWKVNEKKKFFHLKKDSKTKRPFIFFKSPTLSH